MKNCPQCNAPLNDDAVFCTNCGTSLQPNQQQPNNQAQGNGFNPNPQYAQAAPVTIPTDHTSEFSAQEVADNKLFAASIYLFGFLGLAIALIANLSNKSNYIRFHIKQGLKIEICAAVVAVVTVVLFWTFIVPIAGAIAIVILEVVNIICFVQTLRNMSVEPPIINSIKFLK